MGGRAAGGCIIWTWSVEVIWLKLLLSFSTCVSIYLLLNIHSYCHDIDKPDSNRMTNIAVFGKTFHPCPKSNLTTSFSFPSYWKGAMETRLEIFLTIFWEDLMRYLKVGQVGKFNTSPPLADPRDTPLGRIICIKLFLQIFKWLPNKQIVSNRHTETRCGIYVQS